ncbi:MAG: hypothetical protein CL933_02575 [Deltaproteobacteria bacterium]|nr:hypothetical protein [Deltaproteobacteria bacterium]
MNRRLIPGQEEFDLARCIGLVGGVGFDGAIVLEVLNAECRECSLHDFVRDSIRSGRPVFRAREGRGDAGERPRP